jgi:hypothetical protein
MKYLLILLIKIYRIFISPLFGRKCRFYPSCSAYALQSINKHGTIKGGYLSVKRILRCHPWNYGGYDPVPDEFKF